MHCIHDKFCDLTFFIFLKVNMRNLNNVNFCDLVYIYLSLKFFLHILFECRKIICSFAVADRSAEAPVGDEVRREREVVRKLTVSEASEHNIE